MGDYREIVQMQTGADYRSYRDASSKEHLKAAGIDVKNDAVYPDLAFSLPRAVVPTMTCLAAKEL
jgi:polysaccharide pyruvyl transferase WcaK-like protein